MAQLLKQAITEIEKLSEDAQDAIATQLLADLQDELAWDDSFAATTDAQWDKMAEMVRKEIAEGNFVALDAGMVAGRSGLWQDNSH